MTIHPRYLASLALVGAACSSPTAASPEPRARFSLQCKASNTATNGEVHCIRTDTQSGTIVKVELFKLPVSQGPTGGVAGRAGRFQTECAAASTSTKSDFYCVRLDTETGELLLVNMQKIPPFPVAAR